MSSASGKKTLGSAIDEIVMALEALDEAARATAVRAACEHLGLAVPVLGETGASSGSTPAPVPEHDVSLTSAAPPHPITDV